MHPSPLSNSRALLSPPKEAPYALAVTPHVPPTDPHQPPAVSSLHSICMDLPIPDISCDGACDICGLLGLVSFTWQNGFQVPPCHSIHQNLVPCYGRSMAWIHQFDYPKCIKFIVELKIVQSSRPSLIFPAPVSYLSVFQPLTFHRWVFTIFFF